MNQMHERYPIGSEEFIEGYYGEGESYMFGDICNYASPLSDLGLPITQRDPLKAVPHLKTFLGVLRLVAEREDDLYTYNVRLKVKEILARHAQSIEKFLSATTPSLVDLLDLKPLTDEWVDYKLQRLKERIERM